MGKRRANLEVFKISVGLDCLLYGVASLPAILTYIPAQIHVHFFH